MQKELSTPAEEIKSENGTSNKININDRLNNLLIKMTTHLEVLNPEKKDYCNVKFQQLNTIKRVISLLKEQSIHPGFCRMDCGSYIKEVCDYLHQEKIIFYIRAEQSNQLLFEASLSENWKKTEIGIQQYETLKKMKNLSLNFTMPEEIQNDFLIFKTMILTGKKCLSVFWNKIPFI